MNIKLVHSVMYQQLKCPGVIIWNVQKILVVVEFIGVIDAKDQPKTYSMQIILRMSMITYMMSTAISGERPKPKWA